MLQARMSEGDPRLYNVNRDVAHNFDFVITTVAERLEAGGWPIAGEIAKAHGVTDEELGKACQALCVFVAGQMDRRESMAQGLERSGFLAVHPVARLLVTAHLGNVTLGIHWAGVREATMGGEGPAMAYQDLANRGAECSKLMGRPRWLRWWYRIGARIQRISRAMRTEAVVRTNNPMNPRTHPGLPQGVPLRKIRRKDGANVAEGPAVNNPSSTEEGEGVA